MDSTEQPQSNTDFKPRSRRALPGSTYNFNYAVREPYFTMSSNLMDTEPGGESTQYETIPTAPPHQKQSGQLGSTSSNTQTATGYTSAPSQTSEADARARGEKTAENIRYGQGISEQAGESEGKAQEGGYGRVKAQEEAGGGEREAQGYGGKEDMREDVGA